MSSVVTAVLKATIGLLASKGRDVAARKLKEGDVTDQKFRGLIVREIDDIKSKLEGIARKELLASISFFKEGIEFLYELFDKVRFRRNEISPLTSQAGQSTSTEATSLSKRMRRLELADLNESASRALANAKERFKDARREATKAFANTALELSDRILAMQYRVMAIILETVDNPDDALPACRVCIEELHNLSAVKECFKVEFEKGLKARLGKDDRRAIISTVCHVNRVIYDVTLMACFGNKALEICPFVDIGQKNIDPLRDTRIAKVLQKQGMEHCCVPWVFGQGGEEEYKLKHPRGIAANTEGHLLVGDEGDASIKVFDSNRNFLLSFNPKADDTDTKLDILDVATDVDSKTYVLVGLKKPNGEAGYDRKVHVFNKAAEPQSKFAVSAGIWGWNRLAVLEQ